ncbi:MAG: phenylalanine--tRNA ligase subunit beta [Moraxella sp.]|nr:phenylalanine--tRNA ligase subunit beta [Moraxella sp.]
MKVSEYWLKQWLNLTDSAERLGEALTMAGLELDDLYKVAPDFSGVVTGQVLDCAPHPDADKLKVTHVTIGDDTPLQIVCGAPNVRTGLKVAVATIGAVLPSDDNKGFKIKKGKLRGVESHGMLCSASELGLIDEIDGLLELPDDAPIGVNIRDYLQLDNHILDIAITPNRGDCLSVLGLARELSVIYKTALQRPTISPVAPTNDTHQAVRVDAPTACPRYYAQVLSQIDRSIPSPKWLKDALIASGLRTHNFLVDVTNYVLLELGQPLHAFDKDKIIGDIVVRNARQGEQFQLLNENTITLSGDELVIADDVGVLALAGIMGGMRSAISDSTTNIVLESAHFSPLAIAGRARRFGLHTDASARFERGVDYELPKKALDRATSLIAHYAHAAVGQISLAESLEALPTPAVISTPIDKISKTLGITIDKADIIDILTRLEIKTQDHGNTLVCTAPTHRFDLSISEDIVEEVARIYGYHNITPVLPALDVDMSYDDSADLTMRLKWALADIGYSEAISFSFSDAKLEALLNDDNLGKTLALANPISSELAVMRRTLLSSLLPIVQHNLNRKQTHLRLFETGLSFVGQTINELVQTPSLAMVATGAYYDKAYESDANARGFDFFDFKADIERLLPANLNPSCLRYERADLDFLHSGQSAYLSVEGVRLGWFGQLHPAIAKALELPSTWVAQFEIEPILALYRTLPTIYTPSKFPQVRRDFAVLVDTAVTWQAVSDLIYAHAGSLLQEAWLFDVYTGERLGDNKKSFAFSLVWQDEKGTLDDDAIKSFSDAVVMALSQHLGAQLRDS